MRTFAGAALIALAANVLLAQGSGRGSAEPGAPPPERPASLGPRDSGQVVLTRVEPEYTDKARQARIQGDVELSVIVRTDGTVGSVMVEKSLDTLYGLDYSAVAAVRRWVFKPRILNGQAVQGPTRVTVPFRLPGVEPDAPRVTLPAEVVTDIHLMREGGMIAPKLKTQVDPVYTSAAMRARITGPVRVEAIIKKDGTVGSARVVRSLDSQSGLDEQALGAARLWTFEPAMLKNVPVATQIIIQLEFQLH